MGQSVIFIPHLTPIDFEWRLFNVRYGVMMVPFVAIFIGFLYSKINFNSRLVLLCLLLLQFGLYFSGFSKVITYQDGVEGLSSSKNLMRNIGWRKTTTKVWF